MMNRLHRELRSLVAGKALSVVLGLPVLALMWRRAEPDAYGQTLSTLAAAEVVALVSAVGLSTLAQRHLPIWLAHARTPRQAMGQLAALMGLRLMLAAVGVALMVWIAQFLMGSDPPAWTSTHREVALALVMTGVMLRSLEEMQTVLMMQAWIQGLSAAAQAARLMVLCVWPSGTALDLQTLLALELGVGVTVVVVGSGAMAQHIRRRHNREQLLQRESPLPWMRAWPGALQFWAIQCLGLVWSLPALRLALHAVAGPAAVAVHAVAQSMVDSLRQATPLVWMTGWLRAAMLRLHAEAPQSGQARLLASAVHRLSLVVLWPVVAAWCVEPVAWYQWAAGQQMAQQAQALSPNALIALPVGTVLAATSLLAPLQNRHLVLSLWAHIQQQPTWGLVASVMAASAVWISSDLLLQMGVWGIPAAMLMAEGLWVFVAGMAWFQPGEALRRWWHHAKPRGGCFISMMVIGIRHRSVPLSAWAAAVLASWALENVAAGSVWRLVVPLFAAASAVLFTAWNQALWPADERQALQRCIPTAWWAWPDRWLQGRGA